MDNRYLKLLEELQECSTLATYMAKNADFNQEYDENLKLFLGNLLEIVQSCKRSLFEATRLQTQGEPWIREVCGTPQS